MPPVLAEPGQMLSEMLTLVAARHKGQFDKAGKPYVLHVLKVMHYLRSDDAELNCIALGHDLVEDTGITFDTLYQMGFTTRIINGIRALTKMPGETEREQLTKVLTNVDACKVKLQDLRHNSDIRRLKGLNEKDFARMQKYHRWYIIIQTRLSNGNWHALLDELK